MPNILVYCVLPVISFIIHDVYASSNISENSDILSVTNGYDSNDDEPNNRRFYRRSQNGTLESYQISLAFLVDVSKPMPDNMQQVRDDIRIIVNHFTKYTPNLVFEYIFVQSFIGGS